MTHYRCAQEELRRLVALRRGAAQLGRRRDVAAYDREIGALLQLSWPCGDLGCGNRVTLGEDVAQRAEMTA